MASITLRSLKGSPLTIQEMDDNFSNINTELGSKLSISNYTASDILTKLKTVDGATSGLDADLVDGLNPDITAANNTIAARDGSGRIAATTFTGNLTGNVTGNVSGNVTGNASGTATNITGVVALANGGTGATTATAARTNLGLGSLATLSTITSSEITNGTIAQIDMAADSVGTSQLINLNVTTAKINDLAVTEAKLANDSVTSAKIASGAVSADELNVVGNGTTSQYLRSDGDGSFTWDTPIGYTGSKIATFTSSGTWTVPDGVTSCRVFVIGGGGAGRIGYSPRVGGLGGWVYAYVNNLTPGANITVTIGNGGAFQAGAGGTSSFGSYATGTGGGGVPTNGDGTNGTGSVGSGATMLTRGANGAQETSSKTVSGIPLIFGTWRGTGQRDATYGGGTNTSALTWSYTNDVYPGAGGFSQNNSNGSGTYAGVGGVVIVEY